MASDLPAVEILVEKAAAPMLEATADNSSVPSTLAPKRQRRPSVRLGDIGDQPTTLRAPSKSWKFNPHFNSKPSNKSRPLTNLVTSNSNGDGTGSYEYDASPLEANGNLIFDSSADRKLRDKDFKSAKRVVRTNSHWRAADESLALDSPTPTPSPLREQSADNVVRADEWYAHSKRATRVIRVSDSQEPLGESDSRDGNGFPDEEVRNWLTELGLGKYSPVFEIHEVDEQVLPFLTMEDLKDMGINAVGSRRKMFCAIQKLRKGFS